MAPASEIIQEWADHMPTPGTPGAKAGPYTFERGRMEKAIQVVCNELPEESRKKKAATTAAAVSAGKAGPAAMKKVKKDDVDFLVRELLLPKHQAEAALLEAGGDLTTAMKSVIVS